MCKIVIIIIREVVTTLIAVKNDSLIVIIKFIYTHELSMSVIFRSNCCSFLCLFKNCCFSNYHVKKNILRHDNLLICSSTTVKTGVQKWCLSLW